MSEKLSERLVSLLSSKALSWEEYADIYQVMENFAERHPQRTAELLPSFYSLVRNPGFNADVAPRAAKVYGLLVQDMNPETAVESFDVLLESGQKRFALRAAAEGVKQQPRLAYPFYEKIRQQAVGAKENDLCVYSRVARDLALSAAEEGAVRIFDDMMRSESEEHFKSAIYASLSAFYKRFPVLQERVLQVLDNQKNAENNLCAYFQNLGEIAVFDADKRACCVEMIATYIGSERNDAASLVKAYTALGQNMPADNPVLAQRAVELVNLGVENPANTLASRKHAWRTIGAADKLCSCVVLGQRVEKSREAEFGWKRVAGIPADEVCVLFLGGDGTVTEKEANGYLASVEKLLARHDLAGRAGLYAVVYDFGDFMNKELARTKMMVDYRRNVKVTRELSEETKNPKYVGEIFDKVLATRISRNGRRLPFKEAADNIRRLNVVTHCHGAYMFLKLEELMQKKMGELGYSPAEREKIQQQLLVVAHAPYCPLGVSKSTMVAFASAQDYEVDHHNHFEASVHRLEKEGKLKMAYFPDEKGNLFLAPSLGKDVEQHNFLGYDTEATGLSKEGQVLIGLSGNVLVNGLKNSLAVGCLPSVKELTSGGNEKAEKLFERLAQNGMEMHELIVADSRRKRQAAHRSGR